jgi:hypothetical protein
MTVNVSLTRDFRQTIVERVRRDPEFAKALLDEAARRVELELPKQLMLLEVRDKRRWRTRARRENGLGIRTGRESPAGDLARVSM